MLFLQGGATQQFDLIPMNLLSKDGYAEYVESGQWASKAAKAAAQYGDARIIASTKDDNYVALPEFSASAEADYLHICSNNTIFGTQFQSFLEHNCLIADMSSDIMSRPLDVSKFGMIYAGAQKNLGPSGVVLAIIRKDLLERCQAESAIFNYAKHAAAESCLNTPPTFGITVCVKPSNGCKKMSVASTRCRPSTKPKLRRSTKQIDDSDGFYSRHRHRYR